MSESKWKSETNPIRGINACLAHHGPDPLPHRQSVGHMFEMPNLEEKKNLEKSRQSQKVGRAHPNSNSERATCSTEGSAIFRSVLAKAETVLG